MTWLWLDDNFARHAKIELLSDAAFRLWAHGLCHAMRNGTDGFVADATLATLTRNRHPRKLADELVTARVKPDGAGLWERDDARGGWSIHDYLEYQPDAELLRERREARRLAQQANGRAGGRRSGEARRAKAEITRGDGGDAVSASVSLPVGFLLASRRPSQLEAKRSPSPSPYPSPTDPDLVAVAVTPRAAGSSNGDNGIGGASAKAQNGAAPQQPRGGADRTQDDPKGGAAPERPSSGLVEGPRGMSSAPRRRSSPESAENGPDPPATGAPKTALEAEIMAALRASAELGEDRPPPDWARSAARLEALVTGGRGPPARLLDALRLALDQLADLRAAKPLDDGQRRGGMAFVLAKVPQLVAPGALERERERFAPRGARGEPASPAPVIAQAWEG